MGIIWNNTMRTGVSELDAQHKELIARLNSLGEAMQSGKGKEDLENILTFAGEYAQKHFQCEEEYFTRYGCPAKIQNKQEHARFMKRFADLSAEFRKQGASFSLVMKSYNELSTWLIHHILGVDTKLRAYIKDQ